MNNLLGILEVGLNADLFQVGATFCAHVLHDGWMLAFLDFENHRSS